MSERQSVLRGLAVGITALAATVALPGPAGAGTGTVAYDCLIFTTHFDYNATVKVSGSGSTGVGDTVTVEADFSDLPGTSPVAVDSWKTTGKLLASGAQDGSYDLAGPNRTGPIAAKAPIPLGKLTASVPLTAAGKVDLTVGVITVTAVAFGSSVPITCTPKAGAPALLSLTVTGASSPVTVLVDPVTLAPGGAFTVTGTGWASGPVTVALCDGEGGGCQASGITGSTLAVDASGKLTGGAKIAAGTAAGAHRIRISQGGVAKDVAVTVRDDTPAPVDPCAAKPSGQCTEQKINLTVNGGRLTLAQAPGEVDLTPVTLKGEAETATGSLKRVTVSDARGASTGWSLVGTLTDFRGPAGATVPAGNLTWTPRCTAHPGASPVTTGTPGTLGATGALLCSVADSTAGPVGGVYDADAGLSLSVPAATAAGEYDAVLTLTLS
ncbi:hypothetical protein [Actinocorallia longicatena]|uniref:Beta-xylosidase n=1 Tax=Actinocorallia longicatena TaxID=111803 RepID=A0ABP6Q3S4_9ACTN